MGCLLETPVSLKKGLILALSWRTVAHFVAPLSEWLSLHSKWHRRDPSRYLEGGDGSPWELSKLRGQHSAYSFHFSWSALWCSRLPWTSSRKCGTCKVFPQYGRSCDSGVSDGSCNPYRTPHIGKEAHRCAPSCEPWEHRAWEKQVWSLPQFYFAGFPKQGSV